MGIGTSKGAFYEDDFEYLRSQWDRKYDTNDQNVLHPNQVQQGQELDQAELDPTTGVGLEVGYRVPEGVNWSQLNKPTGSMSMTDVGDSPLQRQVDDFKVQAGKPVPSINDNSPEAWDEAINVGMSAGPGTIAGVMAKGTGRVTGWWKGSDGKMRYEISDQGMKLKDKDWVEGASGKLGDYLEHPELFKAYPELEKLNFAVAPKSYENLGGFSEKTKTLVLNPGKIGGDEHILDVMAHELQHAVQSIEGFSRGSSPTRALEQAGEALLTKMNQTKDPAAKKELVDLYLDIQQNNHKFADYMYLRVPGEVEANLVAARRQLTDEQRRMMSPNEMNKAFEGERSNLHGGKYVPEFNYP